MPRFADGTARSAVVGVQLPEFGWVAERARGGASDVAVMDFRRIWASALHSSTSSAAEERGRDGGQGSDDDDAVSGRGMGDGEDGIRLTEACVARLNELASTASSTEGAAEGTVLRIAVDGGGCSGFQYSFSLVSAIGPTDRLFESNGAKVVVDDISFEFVKGATVDYVEEMIKSSFAIAENPNSASNCGCGSSFVAK